MLETNDLAIGYGNEVLIKDIHFHVGAGETILLCGSNGSGKSTLLKTLAGFLPPLSGVLRTVPQPQKGHSVVLVPTHIPRTKGFSVMEFILTACGNESGLFGHPSATLLERIHGHLQRLHLESFADRDIALLSDGEFQKVCLAMGLSKESDILLLDEPTAFLDVDNRIRILETIRQAAQETGKTFIFSSHDLEDSLKVCTRIWGISTERQFVDSTEMDRESLLKACFHNYRGPFGF